LALRYDVYPQQSTGEDWNNNSGETKSLYFNWDLRYHRRGGCSM